MIEEEIFLRRWRGAVPDDILQRCLEEGRKRGNIIHAYLCVYDYLRPPRRAATPLAEAPLQPKREAKPEEARKPTVVKKPPRRIPWQLISSAAAFALSAANPLLGLLALPVAALLFSTRRNTVPMWTDGDSLVWLGRRYKFYRVELVFRDINGMGPRELTNTLLSVTRTYNGVYFKEGRAWVLLRDGADVEEMRTTLRRFGVLVAQRPDPPPLKLSRVSPTPYYAMSLLPLAAALVNPVSAVTAGLAAVLQLALTARDAGHAPAADAKPISENLLYLSVPDPEAVWAMARASQPLVDEVLLVWEEDKKALQKIEKAGAGLERWAYWLASAWRMYRLANVQVARTRILNNREQGFEVNGLVRGSLAAFSTGIPRDVVPAFTLDLAEVSPFALLVTPSQCGERSVRLGADDAGRDFCVDLDRIVVPHAIFIGATGSGKTTTAMSFAKQLARLGVRTVAIDPHGHWARFPGAHVVDAREHAPPIQTIAEDDIDLLLDVLRAAGVQVLDVHFTVLLNAVQRCGGSASLRQLPECLLKVRDLSNA
ncbi:helicase HerA domain-containing protein, partial [Pyrobaculum sp.]|uniref:helicase HerA domain-containing protein n=1 Tax=Pyrobaculum sp. TaxID=2004705 RepID=UPI003D0A7BD7